MNSTNVVQILVADDDPVTRLILGKMLKSVPGFEVTALSDGEAAWRWLEEGHLPDVCIFDLIMPQCGGLDLLRRIRSSARLKNIRVILCSTLGDRATVEEAVTLAPDYYVLKPFKKELILQRVRQAAARSQTRPVWDTSARVCQRLGIDQKTYDDSVELLLGQIRHATPLLLQALARGGDLEGIDVSFSAVKGAAATLGAGSVVALVDQVQGALNAFENSVGIAPADARDEALQTWRRSHERSLEAALALLESEVVGRTEKDASLRLAAAEA